MPVQMLSAVFRSYWQMKNNRTQASEIVNKDI